MPRAAVGMLLLAGSLSCTSEVLDLDRPPAACLAYAAAGLRVEVTNAATAQPICDAMVVATDRSYSEQLFGTSCAFIGAYERPGTYVVSVSKAGFTPKEMSSVRVVMGGGDCPHVEQARVAIALAPVR
jgi:hypothetical protein